MVKNGKFVNPYLTENRLNKNEMWWATDTYNDTCHTCAKGLLDSNFHQEVIKKISNFQEIAPNFTDSQNS